MFLSSGILKQEELYNEDGHTFLWDPLRQCFLSGRQNQELLNLHLAKRALIVAK
jgi:hypothetical protein